MPVHGRPVIIDAGRRTSIARRCDSRISRSFGKATRRACPGPYAAASWRAMNGRSWTVSAAVLLSHTPPAVHRSRSSSTDRPAANCATSKSIESRAYAGGKRIFTTVRHMAERISFLWARFGWSCQRPPPGASTYSTGLRSDRPVQPPNRHRVLLSVDRALRFLAA